MTLNILVYLPVPSSKGRELVNLAKSSLAGSRVTVLSDLEDFFGWIPASKNPATVAIIWNPTHIELRRIRAIKDLLTGVRMVLVLADEEPETIALAHQIMPAYISYIDDGITEIVSVLERLAGTAAPTASESRL